MLGLPEPYRSTLLLRYFDGWSPAKIAKEKGLSPATVRSHVARGLERLRARLDDRHDGDRDAWCLALVPLAFPKVGGALLGAALAKGSMAMNATKIGVAAAAAVVLIWLGTGWFGPSGSATSTPAVADGAEAAERTAAVEQEEPEPVALLEGPETPAPVEAAAANDRVETSLLRGRVVEAGTDAPLTGFVARFVSDGSELASAQSDETGAFALTPPESATSVVLELVAPVPGWTIEPAELLLADLDLRQPVTFVATPWPERRFLGRVVDMETGESVPWFDLRVEGTTVDGPAEEWVATDELGLFGTEASFTAGELTIYPLDSSSEDFYGRYDIETQLRHDPAADAEAVPEVHVQIGATYELHLSGGPSDAPEELVAVAYSVGPGKRRSGVDGKTNAAPVRAARNGGRPWVRFGHLTEEILEAVGGPWELEVRSRDGLWAGRARVDVVEGRQPDPVELRLREHGSVEGRVFSADGGELGVPSATLVAEDGREERETTVAHDGTFHLGAIPAGVYRLHVGSRRHHPFERTLEVVAGEAATLDVELQRQASAGDIRGTVTSDSGRFSGHVFVQLSSPDRKTLSGSVQWQEVGGEQVGSFAFEDVAAGQYRLFFQSLSGDTFEPELIDVSPPALDVAVVCHDRPRGAPVVIRAYDAKTGEPIETFEGALWALDYDLPTPEAGTRTIRAPLTAFPLARSGEPLTMLMMAEQIGFRVSVGGYASAFGDWRDLTEETDEAGEPIRVAHVGLEPGWGTRFTVTGPDEEPLEGVVVILDDVEAGSTDSEGVLDVRLDEAPERVELFFRDWLVVGGALDPATGVLSTEQRGAEVRMGPRD